MRIMLSVYLFRVLRCYDVKGIVHFEIKIWYLSDYPKGIQDVGVYFSSVDPILMFLGKKRYKYCSFSHTNRSFRVLGHQCVVTMGNCLIWISLCMFFFPLIETVTYTCHYMTDRLERFDLKTSKLDLLKKKRHLHLGCPWGKLIDTTF